MFHKDSGKIRDISVPNFRPVVDLERPLAAYLANPHVHNIHGRNNPPSAYLRNSNMLLPEQEISSFHLRRKQPKLIQEQSQGEKKRVRRYSVEEMKVAVIYDYFEYYV